jgi:hypothetical protein
MALSKDWRTIMWFAVAGFALGVVSSASSLVTNMSSMAVTFLLCPAALLCLPLFAWAFEAAETGTLGFYILWGFVALINAILYALIAAAYIGSRQRPTGASTGQ